LLSQNGLPGALTQVRKTGGVSTLAVIDAVKEVLPDIRRLIPNDVTLTPIFELHRVHPGLNEPRQVFSFQSQRTGYRRIVSVSWPYSSIVAHIRLNATIAIPQPRADKRTNIQLGMTSMAPSRKQRHPQ